MHLVELIALILLPVGVMMCGYALLTFLWRGRLIAKKQIGHFDDRVGGRRRHLPRCYAAAAAAAAAAGVGLWERLPACVRACLPARLPAGVQGELPLHPRCVRPLPRPQRLPLPRRCTAG
jgi:nitrogen fixation-related uncharacterized protein